MDLESEDEDKENENLENGLEEEADDEKNTSHCMEELWEGGKSLYCAALQLKLTDFALLKEFNCHRSLEANVPGSCRCVDICIMLLNR